MDTNHTYRLLACIVSCLLVCVQLRAQEEQFNEQWRWVYFNTESGLPSNHVDAIYEAADGVPWVVTSAGLAWYDGFRWNPVNDSSGLLKKPFVYITTDTDNGLLVCTFDHSYKVTKDAIEKKFFRYHGKELEISSIAPIDDRRFLVGVDTSIFMLRDGILHPIEIPGRPNYGITQLLLQSGAGTWIIRSSGIYRWNAKQWDLKLKSGHEPYQDIRLIEGKHGDALMWIKSPLEARGLWELSEHGLPVHNKREGVELIQTADFSPDGDALAIYEAGDIRVKRNGVWSNLDSAPNQLRNVVFVKYRSNGDLWVGNELGLYLFRHTSQRWTYWKHPFPNFKNTIHAILQTHDGLIWLGTAQGVEVRRCDGSIVREFDRIDGHSLPIITGLCEDKDGAVWISSGSQMVGAYRWDGVKWRHFGEKDGLNAPRVHKIVKDSQGRLWFLGLGVPYAVSPQPGAFLCENGEFRPWDSTRGLPNGRVYAFVQSKDGGLWFGTRGGLFRWMNGTWTAINELNGMRVFALAADSSNNIWFGENSISPTGSLGYVDSKDRVHFIPLTDRHIYKTEIWDLAIDKKGTLWMATRGGEGVLSYRNGVWSSFDLATGLSSLKIWPLLVTSDRLYAGTDGNGVNILDLNESENQSPRIEIDAPSVDAEKALFRWRVHTYWGVLPAWQVYSRHKLDDGLWSDWTTDREVSRLNLSPGGHVLTVQAKGLFGNYDLSGTSIAFAVQPPFYFRPVILFPMIVLSGTVACLGLIMFIRKRKNDAAIREREGKLRTVTETTSSAIIIFRDSRIYFANSSAEALTGFTRGELLAMSFFDFVHPDHHRIVNESGKVQFSGGDQRYHAELKILTKKKEERWVDFTAGKIDLEGEPAVLGTAIDITERKLGEEKLLAYQEQLKSLATELSRSEDSERRRMATYLHDSVSQSLAFCQTKLTTLKEFRGDSSESELLEEINSLLEDALENLQSLTFELSPPILYELSFEDAVEWLAEQMEERYKLHVAVANDGQPKTLSDDLRLAIFQAVREVLVNVVKHAQTKEAKLSMMREGHSMKIVIEDSGRGFDAASHNNHPRKTGGFGLFNIRERLTYLGGHVEIHSRLNQGTQVTITVPLAN